MTLNQYRAFEASTQGLVTVKTAAQIGGYRVDYVRTLASNGHINRVNYGGKPFICLESLWQYMQQTHRAKSKYVSDEALAELWRASGMTLSRFAKSIHVGVSTLQRRLPPVMPDFDQLQAERFEQAKQVRTEQGHERRRKIAKRKIKNRDRNLFAEKTAGPEYCTGCGLKLSNVPSSVPGWCGFCVEEGKHIGRLIYRDEAERVFGGDKCKN